MIYLQLIWEFFLTGLFAVGGGLATLPFLYEMAERYPWFSAELLPEMVAISESTPGPIGINMATYAGFHATGLLGGLLATLAIVLPQFLIIVTLSKPLSRVRGHRITESVFHMLRPASTALIAYACWETLKSTLLQLPAASFESMFCWQNIAIFAIVWILYDRFHGHPIFYIIGCAALGILFQL
ncbi:MAG: chromate transporter [bacterium]|nr:chromate transporter [bacterium]